MAHHDVLELDRGDPLAARLDEILRAVDELDVGAVGELREFLAERVAKWWIPERIEFIDEVPKTSVGKFDKKVLRRRLAEEAASDSAS